MSVSALYARVFDLVDDNVALQREKPTGLERYIFLNGLKGRDPTLFYELLLRNMPVCRS